MALINFMILFNSCKLQTWEKAQLYCEGAGLKAATIETENQANFIRNTLIDYQDSNRPNLINASFKINTVLHAHHEYFLVATKFRTILDFCKGIPEAGMFPLGWRKWAEAS